MWDFWRRRHCFVRLSGLLTLECYFCVLNIGSETYSSVSAPWRFEWDEVFGVGGLLVRDGQFCVLRLWNSMHRVVYWLILLSGTYCSLRVFGFWSDVYWRLLFVSVGLWRGMYCSFSGCNWTNSVSNMVILNRVCWFEYKGSLWMYDTV